MRVKVPRLFTRTNQARHAAGRAGRAQSDPAHRDWREAGDDAITHHASTQQADAAHVSRSWSRALISPTLGRPDPRRRNQIPIQMQIPTIRTWVRGARVGEAGTRVSGSRWRWRPPTPPPASARCPCRDREGATELARWEGTCVAWVDAGCCTAWPGLAARSRPAGRW